MINFDEEIQKFQPSLEVEDAEDAIYRKISDITISMKSTDHLQMPELITSQYEVQLSEDEEQRYEEIKADFILELPEGEITDYRTAYSGITPAILKNCKNRISFKS